MCNHQWAEFFKLCIHCSLKCVLPLKSCLWKSLCSLSLIVTWQIEINDVVTQHCICCCLFQSKVHKFIFQNKPIVHLQKAAGHCDSGFTMEKNHSWNTGYLGKLYLDQSWLAKHTSMWKLDITFCNEVSQFKVYYFEIQYR